MPIKATRHRPEHPAPDDESPERPAEIALVGDLSENESDVYDKMLALSPGADCTLYINCPGGNAYSAISLMTLIRVRGLRVTGLVAGECSSAALWPFAACSRRLVTPYSVLLFHPMKWQSEEHVQLSEATEWARHFGRLEQDMDQLLADLFGTSSEQIHRWMQPGCYVTGEQLAAAGLAELIALAPLAFS